MYSITNKQTKQDLVLSLKSDVSDYWLTNNIAGHKAASNNL